MNISPQKLGFRSLKPIVGGVLLAVAAGASAAADIAIPAGVNKVLAAAKASREKAKAFSADVGVSTGRRTFEGEAPDLNGTGMTKAEYHDLVSRLNAHRRDPSPCGRQPATEVASVPWSNATAAGLELEMSRGNLLARGDTGMPTTRTAKPVVGASSNAWLGTIVWESSSPSLQMLQELVLHPASCRLLKRADATSFAAVTTPSDGAGGLRTWAIAVSGQQQRR